MKTYQWLTIVTSLVLLGSTGCVTQTPSTPQYQLQAEREKDGPPPPVATIDSVKAAGLVHDSVKIHPETSVGYGDLPATVTQLFDGETVPLALTDVVSLTLDNERGLKIEGYNVRIAQYEIPVSKGIYDLMMTARAGHQRIETQASAAGIGRLGVNSQRFRTASMGLSQLLPSGATINLGYDFVRATSLFSNFNAAAFTFTPATNKTFEQVFSLAFVQPLLRGFGPAVTNANIRIAQLENAGAAADFQTTVEQTMVDVLSTYWQLIGAIELYKVRVISYSAARDLLRVNTAKFDAGVLPQTDVLQAQAAAEKRREEVILARRDVREIEDELKQRIFLTSGQPRWEAQIQPSQTIAWREMEVDLDRTIEVALAERPELRRAQVNIEKSGVNLTVAKNAKLPQLNMVGEVDSQGLGDNYDHSWDSSTDGKYTSYNIGLELSYPLQNRAARYRHSQAQAINAQATEGLAQLQDQITLQVRRAVRAVRTARERIAVTNSQVVSEEEKLRSEQKRYDVGISTAFEVLTFQDDLANAQAQHLNAVVDYNIAAIELERARGTLLPTYGVEVLDPTLNPDTTPVLFPVSRD